MSAAKKTPAPTAEQRRAYKRAVSERAAFGLPPLHATVEAYAAHENARRERLAASPFVRAAIAKATGGAA